MKIRIVENKKLNEGAEEVGATLGRGIDRIVAHINDSGAKDKVIKALGGYTQEEYQSLIDQIAAYGQALGLHKAPTLKRPL